MQELARQTKDIVAYLKDGKKFENAEEDPKLLQKPTKKEATKPAVSAKKLEQKKAELKAAEKPIYKSEDIKKLPKFETKNDETKK